MPQTTDHTAAGKPRAAGARWRTTPAATIAAPSTATTASMLTATQIAYGASTSTGMYRRAVASPHTSRTA